MKLLLRALLTVLFLASVSYAQTTVKVAYDLKEASRFGYAHLSSGIFGEVAHRRGKLEGFFSATASNAHKAYVGDGHQLGAAVGARFWINDRYFVIGGLIAGRDTNSQYTKTAVRGFAGAGAQLERVRLTVTGFAAPSLVTDPNTSRGITFSAEYAHPIVGRLGFFTYLQGTVASFDRSGGYNDRVVGSAWLARTGITLSF